MHTSTKTTTTSLRTTLCMLLCILFYAYSPTAAVSLDSLSSKLQALTNRIDSIDLVKQEFKRNAVPLTDLEQQQTSLRDSLATVRSAIQKQTTSSPTQHKKRHPNKAGSFLPHPTNLFDWIILIVGGIAIMSGILLITGIIKRVATQPTRPRQLKTKPDAPSAPPEKQIHQDNSYPLYTPAGLKQGTRDIPDKNKQLSPESTNLSSLRNRMRTELPPASAALPPTLPSVPKSPPVKPTPPQSEEPVQKTKEQSVEAQVIAESKKGTDIATLSRMFHLSSDHIALILKISKNR